MTDNANTGRFSYDGLDRVIHEKARLSVLTSLMSHPKGLSFADLKNLCGLTDGNLSRHMKVLQDANLVSVKKGYQKNRPHTHCKITPAGQAKFLEYINVLEQIVRDAADTEANAGKATGNTSSIAAKPS